MVLTSSASSSSQAPPACVDIRVVGIDNGTFSHPIQPTTSVAEIKRVVNQKYHIHPANQQVQHSGDNLEDDRIVANIPDLTELLVQVADDFPHALPRFSVVPLNNIAGIDVKIWQTQTGLVANTQRNVGPHLKKIITRMFKKMKNIMFQLSPMSPITLNDDIRGLLQIPESATHFSWAYPPAGQTRFVLKAGEEAELQNLASFFSVGGFVYFDEDLSPESISFTALLPDPAHGALSFGQPKQWPHLDLTRCLAGRFHPITIEDMNKAGAMRYCWVQPGETFDGAIPENQHGMFVYLFHEVSDGTDEQIAMSRYFCVQDDAEDADEDDEEGEDDDGSSGAAAPERFFRAGPRLSNFEQSTNGIIPEPQQPPTMTDAQRLVELQQQQQRLEQQMRCVVCLEADKNTVFIPCGHKACCFECANMIDPRNCPICRALIREINRCYDI